MSLTIEFTISLLYSEIVVEVEQKGQRMEMGLLLLGRRKQDVQNK